MIKARVIACVSFDRGICGFQSSTWVYIESLDVAIVPKQKVGRGSYFDGKAHLAIPRFTNSYSRFSEFAISFWYKRVGRRRGEQGLVTNSNSGQPASISIVSTENALSVRLLTDSGTVSLTGVPVSIDRPSPPPSPSSLPLLLLDRLPIILFNGVLLIFSLQSFQLLPGVQTCTFS